MIEDQLHRISFCVSEYMEPMKQYISLFFFFFLLLRVSYPASAKNSCLTGGFFFTPGNSMVDNHALLGYVIADFKSLEPIDCFRACRLECRCISFNYYQAMKYCILNEESRYTNASALMFVKGWHYYDLVINYNIKVRNQLT